MWFSAVFWLVFSLLSSERACPGRQIGWIIIDNNWDIVKDNSINTGTLQTHDYLLFDRVQLRNLIQGAVGHRDGRNLGAVDQGLLLKP